MSIRRIGNEETFSTASKWDAKTKTMHVTFAVRKSGAKTKDGKYTEPRYAVSSDLDFSKVSTEEMAELATSTMVIDLQRLWRIAANSVKSTATTINPFVKVDVKARLDADKKTASPVERARGALAKLGEAERKALLAELMASVQAPAKAA